MSRMLIEIIEKITPWLSNTNEYLILLLVGKRPMGKCTSGEITGGQITSGEMYQWGNVSGEMIVGK